MYLHIGNVPKGSRSRIFRKAANGLRRFFSGTVNRRPRQHKPRRVGANLKCRNAKLNAKATPTAALPLRRDRETRELAAGESETSERAQRRCDCFETLRRHKVLLLTTRLRSRPGRKRSRTRRSTLGDPDAWTPPSDVQLLRLAPADWCQHATA